MKKLLFLSLLICIVISVGCRKRCDCLEDTYDDSVFFRFDTSASQFSASEIGTAYVLQHPKGDTANILDTIAIVNRESLFTFIIGEIDNDFENYEYRVRGNGSYNYRFAITDLQIQGENTEGSCKCYQNTMKKGKLNGTSFDKTGSSDFILLQK